MILQNRKRKRFAASLVVIGILVSVLAVEVLAACTYTLISQSTETTANLCPDQDGTYYVLASDKIQWSNSIRSTLVEAVYPTFKCATDSAVITRSSGLFIDETSEPWIDYDYYKIELAYRTTNVPNTKFIVDEAYSLACARQHPSPIVINFDKRALQFTGPESGVDFDLSSLGTKQRLGWTQANANVAFVIRGTNATSGQQLFGNLNEQAPPLTEGESENGYRALRVFDLNGDQQINAADPIWLELNLWFDRNHNGLSEPEEVVSLSSQGVVSISLNYLEVGKRDQFANYHRQRASVSLIDGSSRWSTDVYPAQSNEPYDTSIEVIEPRR